MVEKINEHYKQCPAKKFLEEEELNYKKNIKELIDNDLKLAKKLYSSQKPIMDTRKDTEIAKKLQKELKPLINTSKDEEMAKKLQREMKPLINTTKDEEIAKKLQMEFMKNDEEIGTNGN